MIDDLVTRGVSEPYRMFTSRAEFRLTLRADNADQRLTDKGIALGCVGSVRATHHRVKMETLVVSRETARALSITPTEAGKHGIALNQDGQRRSAFELLSYPGIGIADLTRVWPDVFGALDSEIATHLEIDAKYAVYLERQAADVEAFRRDENLLLGDDIDYAVVTGLSNEARARLSASRPRTIGQAARLDGLTPAALTLLAAHLKRKERKSAIKAS
jgi:tRNA uridine 5-carboxymethylaminomethyl modification enzyme